MYDEDIGYCQGQSFLAAVLLLHVSNFPFLNSIVLLSLLSIVLIFLLISHFKKLIHRISL